MQTKSPQQLSLKKIYSCTVSLLRQNPHVFIPFLAVALFELVGLVICYSAPRMPLRALLGPPIRTFWGERFLHYPFNFLLLPKLVSHVRMLSSVFVGSLMTAAVSLLVAHYYKNGVVKIEAVLRATVKKYISLFTLVLLLTLAFYFLMKGITVGLAKYFLAGHARLLFVKSAVWMGPLLLCINFLVAVLLNSVLVYAIPFLIIENKKLLAAIGCSARLFARNLSKTILLVMLPMFLYLPIIVLNFKTNYLIMNVSPEFVGFVQVAGILLTCLVIDPLVTVSTTTFYLSQRETASAAGEKKTC